MWSREPIFCMPISGRHSNGKTHGVLKFKSRLFLTGLVGCIRIGTRILKMGVGTFQLRAMFYNSVCSWWSICLVAQIGTPGLQTHFERGGGLQVYRPISKEEAKWIVLKYEEIKSVQSVRRAFQKRFCPSHPKKGFCVVGILTTAWPSQEHWFHETRNISELRGCAPVSRFTKRTKSRTGVIYPEYGVITP